jgi:hypothetical protein
VATPARAGSSVRLEALGAKARPDDDDDDEDSPIWKSRRLNWKDPVNIQRAPASSPITENPTSESNKKAQGRRKHGGGGGPTTTLLGQPPSTAPSEEPPTRTKGRPSKSRKETTIQILEEFAKCDQGDKFFASAVNFRRLIDRTYIQGLQQLDGHRCTSSCGRSRVLSK